MKELFTPILQLKQQMLGERKTLAQVTRCVVVHVHQESSRKIHFDAHEEQQPSFPPSVLGLSPCPGTGRM